MCVTPGTTAPSAPGTHSSSSLCTSANRGGARRAVAAEDREGGRADPSRLRLSKGPRQHAGRVVVELEGRVGHCLRERARQEPVQHRTVAGPASLEGRVDRGVGAIHAVPLGGGCQRSAVAGAARAEHQRRLEHGEGMHDLRRIECELQGDVAAVGVSDDMLALDAEVSQHARTRRHPHRLRPDRGAARVTPTEAEHEPVASVTRLGQQGRNATAITRRGSQ